jgi:hypothetical protein
MCSREREHEKDSNICKEKNNINKAVVEVVGRGQAFCDMCIKRGRITQMSHRAFFIFIAQRPTLI